MIAPAAWTRSASAATISAPNVIGGTKWPSITSTWMTRAPAASTSSTCSPRRAKSADRIEGAIRRSRSSAASRQRARSMASHLDRPQHAAVAVVAGDDRRARHPHDRRVLAAVRAYRDQLVALQAVHAAVTPGAAVGRSHGSPHPGHSGPSLAADRSRSSKVNGPAAFANEDAAVRLTAAPGAR